MSRQNPQRRARNHARGSRNGNWNKGRIVSQQGYVKVRVGRDHPLADPYGYAYEHHVVWLSAGNPAPSKTQCIHHRNEDKADNRIANLELVSRSEHSRRHVVERRRRRNGRFA